MPSAFAATGTRAVCSQSGTRGRLFMGVALPRESRSGIVSSMSKLEALEKRVSGLSAEELTQFRQWFAEFDAAAWDRQIEQDVNAGKLDALADEALRDHAGGKSSEF
jgi:hypothetical protein